jgi:subtilisin family serine protease
MKNRYGQVSRPALSRVCPILIVLLLFAASGVRPAMASDASEPVYPYPHVPGEVLIGWQPDTVELPRGAPPKAFVPDRASADWQSTAQTLETRTGLAVLDAEPYYGTARLAVPPGQEQAEIARLSAMPWIDYAEPNYIAHAADTYPNDPYIGSQWNMRRIYAPAAWDLTMGSYSIVVAVVDSGIDPSHPEFAGRILPGYDYVNGDYAPDDDNNHGTHVSGIIAAAANNGLGVAGLAANVKILPLKVLDSNGSGSYYNISLAIMSAADSSAQIINLSLQGLAVSDTLHNAVIYAANDRGRLAVAAAGNYGNLGNPEVYPAAYSEAFTVAASTHDDEWASYSSYNDHVDLAAPGGTSGDQILSTLRVSSGSYGYEYGTSMAAPLASAAAALVWTYLPAASRLEITGILKETADKAGSFAYDLNGRNPYFGYGRLNIGRAVRRAYPPSLSPSPAGTQSFLLGGPVQQASGQVAVANPSIQPLSWQATVLQGGDWLKLSTSSGTASFGAPGSLAFRAEPTALPPGQYPGLIHVSYNSGASGFDLPAQLRVAANLQRAFIPQAANGYLAANWVDPLPGGQALNLPDNGFAQVALPFPVIFYDQLYSSIWVSDNGVALFTLPAAAGVFDPANCMPGAKRPNDAYYVLWQDWLPQLGGNVYVHQPDNDTFAITWYQVVRTGSPVPHSFQLVLTRDGRALFQYQTVASPVQGTIGIENFDGTVAQQILCNGVGRQVRSGDALLMNPQVPW